MSFQSINEIDDALRANEVSVRDLHAAYDQRQPVPDSRAKKSAGKSASNESRRIPWLQDSLDRALLFTKRALDSEEFLLVCDSSRETLDHWTGGNDDERTALVRVRMNYAAALTRLGCTHDARALLEPFVGDHVQPRLGQKLRAEILMLLGNILRDESQHLAARAARLQTAQQALEYYQRALGMDPQRLDALTLTAAASLVLGEPGSALREQAHEAALRILELTKNLLEIEGPRIETTRHRATAQAVLGEVDSAAQSYGELQGMEGVTTRGLADARYYAQFLAEALGKPRDFFKKAFPPLQLVVFVGHLPDLPGQPSRFPLQSVERVREEISAKIAEMDARVGLVSAAAGADLLFADELRKRKGTVHLVLPWSQEEFRQTSVRPFEPAGASLWEPLFDQALLHARTIRELGQAYVPSDDVSWSYMMEVTAGLALHTARVSRLDVQPLALWDGLPGWGSGGTSSFVEFWSGQLRQDPMKIDPPTPSTPESRHAIRGSSHRSERSTMHQEVKSMLFADIVGYSKLHESVIPEFVEVFMTRVSQLAGLSKYAPRSLNTWGDAIYAIFDFARDAGRFALELTQMIKEGEKDWLQKGLYWSEPRGEGKEPLKHPLNIRIGLHTGPVFMHYDPVVRRLGFTGAHVNRAARIEPVAKPGEVFASEEFAAMAELEAEIQRRGALGGAEANDIGFVCEYAGSMQLAKGYPGLFRIYRLLAKRVFAIEELAKAAHESYFLECQKRGDTPATNSAMCLWKDLPEDLRDANRAQVADIPNKLHYLGYELAPSYGLDPSQIKMSDSQIEDLAVREHDRWMKDRINHRWTYAPQRDNGRKHHPLLVPWKALSDPEKEKDRDTVRNVPHLIKRAGFRVRQLAEAT